MEALVIGKKGIERVNSFSLITSYDAPEQLLMRTAIKTKAGKTPIKTSTFSLEIKPYAFPNAESLYDNDIVLAYHEQHKFIGTVTFVRDGLYYGITCTMTGNVYPLYKCSLIQRLGNALDGNPNDFLFLLDATAPAFEKDAPAAEKNNEAPSKNTPLVIYTDGSCLMNPGPCSWAYIITKNDEILKEDSGFISSGGTNNIAELTAVITALKQLKKKQPIILKSDSKYIVDAFNKGWLRNWVKNHFLKADKTPIANQALWEELLSLTKDKDITFEWVRGHDGNPFNERCDFLAKEAASNEIIS